MANIRIDKLEYKENHFLHVAPVGMNTIVFLGNSARSAEKVMRNAEVKHGEAYVWFRWSEAKHEWVMMFCKQRKPAN